MAKKLYTLPDLLRDLSEGKNPSSAKVRGVISRDLQKYFRSSDAYDNASIQVINAFNSAVTKGDKAVDITPFTEDVNLMGPNPVGIRSRGPGKIADQDMRKFFVEVIPDIFQNRDLGHANISVLTFKLKAALSQGYLPKNLEQKVRTLLKIAQYIDSLDGGERIPRGKVQETLLEIIDTMKGTGVWEKNVKFSGNLANLVIEYEAEESVGNQAFKGQLAAQLGRVFSRLQKGNEEYYERVILGKGIDNLKSSPTVVDDVEELWLEFFHKQFPGTKNFKAKKPKKSKDTASYRGKSKSKPKKRQKRSYPGAKTPPSIETSPTSIVTLLSLFNQNLPRAVAKNMGAPALENRTGRFASSVKVTDIVATPQGFPSVGYTYQKNPYQTFERGFAQGDTERDPRDLIDKSIREIAATIVKGRLYTRRI